VTTGFLYKDQLEPIADVNGDGSIRSVYVYGEKAHVPSYMIRGGEKFAFVSDERGSVRMVVAMGSGSVVQELRYDVWGRVVFDSNPGFQPFGYAGGIYDDATGLVRFGARDFDAEIGRWLSKDPIGFKDGYNLFVYVRNDPINSIDIEGESSIASNSTEFGGGDFRGGGFGGGGIGGGAAIGGAGVIGGAITDFCLSIGSVFSKGGKQNVKSDEFKDMSSGDLEQLKNITGDKQLKQRIIRELKGRKLRNQQKRGK
jgi:RHS repeat-associated protein